ncbi:MAG: hypothetical protein KBH51_03080 [Synergistales bacterium]|nr:hypothetical protein [Synergistales bacterium]
MSSIMPFELKDCEIVMVSTGLRAQTMRELRDALEEAPDGSLLYHFWGWMLRPYLSESEYNNDFATWVDKSLRDQALAERLSVINPSHYEDLGALKNRLLDILDERLVQGDFLTWAKGEMEFVFLKAQMIIFNSGIRIMQPKDLAPAVAQAPTGSIFYHFIDAQRRSPICCDDFSYWLEQFGDETAEARKKISMIDPYLFSLSELRDLIVRALNKSMA